MEKGCVPGAFPERAALLGSIALMDGGYSNVSVAQSLRNTFS